MPPADPRGRPDEVLRDHLVSKGYDSVSARISGRQRIPSGIRSWSSVRRDLTSHLKEDPGCIATTMVDYYGLPKEGDRAWPGRAEAVHAKPIVKAACVEDALSADVATAICSRFDPRRFVPFVMMHEFEALLFSDCAAFTSAIGHPDLESDFREIRNHFPTPEDINDSVISAPSKRIEALVPRYEKPLFGVATVLEMGLARIRAECPHFNSWLNRLESLVV